MKFGFIAHPTSIPLKRHVKLLDVIERMTKDLHSGYQSQLWQWRNTVPFIDFGQITSACGRTCEGAIYYLPLTAQEILTNRHEAQERVLKAINYLQESGAEIVGLGGATSIIGQCGITTAEKANIPVTSGNSLTAYAGYQAILYIFEQLKVNPEGTVVTIVGYPGSIALVLAKLLLKHGCHLNLVHRRKAETSSQLLELIEPEYHKSITLVSDIQQTYNNSLFYIAATSAGGVINPDMLQPGSVVVDIALPRDVMETSQQRKDILIVDGGYVSAVSQMKFGGNILDITPNQQINGCVAETMTLALTGRAETFSIGRELDINKVFEIGNLAKEQGLLCTPLASYGKRLDENQFAMLRKYHHPTKLSVSNCNSVAEIISTAKPLLREEVISRYQEYINPVTADFMRLNRIDRVFVKGQGCTLTDTENQEYLDFVAGYGCLNLGHNHPAITQTLHDFLNASHPTFVQYISIPTHTSFLAELLCNIAPGKMGKVFFSNSGTEAVEAALKLGRAATGRQRIVYTENSYHGKTLGALSVTGRERYRAKFYPLLPGCTSVPFGDIAALEQELAQNDVAAFIVEPIQGEGGVRIPPPNYLLQAQAVCRKYGTLLIVDEIQTGFGRTGQMFACQEEGVEPDVLCLSKSLSGGLMPIGATLCRTEIWQAAYGTVGKFALHTSTFGGGNLAAAAGIAAIQAIQAENLAARAKSVGGWLKQELEQTARQYPFVREVRGKGLMLAVEFANSYEESISATVDNIASRLPGKWHLFYQFFPDEVRYHLQAAVDRLETSLEEMFCLRFVSKMGLDHNILTFITANNNKVMRLQPPLILSQQEAERFALAFKQVCEDLSTFLE